jgi:adenosylcobinamide-GDP ribazoletransferase
MLILKWWQQFLGALTFYTVIPIPAAWQPEFGGIARWSPLVGLLVGGLLGGLDTALRLIGFPALVTSVLVVAGWLKLTGGLHLDGAMDTADGLAISGVQPNHRQQRQLEVMADSRTGAFGVMAAVVIVLLKVAALASLANAQSSFAAIVTAALWGRWGQLLAIACYPYLKPTGKGAFHKTYLQLPLDLVVGSAWVLGWSGWQGWQLWHSQQSLPRLSLAWGTPAIGLLVASSVGYWFYHKLGGHTGDTYGAVVEWTEALVLCYLTIL